MRALIEHMRAMGVVIATMILPTPAMAQGVPPDRVFVLLGSYHALPLAESFPYDETNPGVLLSWAEWWRGLDLAIGLYENSFSDLSVLAALGKSWQLNEDTDLRLVVGLSNYDEEDPIFQPLGNGLVVIPSLQLNWRNVFVQATPIPDPDNLGFVFSYGLTFELN